MRILCLHGFGTSGDIFRSQTVSLRMALKSSSAAAGAGENIDFDFVNAPHDSTPAAGIELFYNPPYYCFWKDDTVENIAAAQAWLDDLIARKGPYDGVMMFSQGCVLGSSVLLHHQRQQTPPPFKFAIFICGGPSLRFLEQELGFTVSPAAKELDQASRKALQERAATAAILAEGSQRWKDVKDLNLTSLTQSSISPDELARQVTGPYQITIPTVHVYGSKDPRYFAGLQLANLCDPQVRRVYDHGGGHEIPRKEVVSSTIASLIRWAVNTAKTTATTTTPNSS
ncbi:hypothetical protein VTN77DRAFT_1954 [Rasamsonia byssochlamydoides]|uniref:uncharacterized protein n=1 Tax=Rasamsonia byssochlamydoides TaxID=89139 RepID=UPI003743D545